MIQASGRKIENKTFILKDKTFPTVDTEINRPLGALQTRHTTRPGTHRVQTDWTKPGPSFQL